MVDNSIPAGAKTVSRVLDQGIVPAAVLLCLGSVGSKFATPRCVGPVGPLDQQHVSYIRIRGMKNLTALHSSLTRTECAVHALPRVPVA